MTDGKTYLKELGQRIVELRKDSDLTQSQLGKEIGVSQQIIASYENGQRNFPIVRLLDLAEVLEISPCELLTGSIEPQPKHKSRLDEQLAAVKKLPAKKRQFVSEFLETLIT